MADVVLKGINVTVYTPNISGIVFWAASNISVQFTTVYSNSSSTCAFGILVYQTETVQVSSVSAYKFRIGIILRSSSNIRTTLTTTRYNIEDGIYLLKIHNINITSTTTTHNGRTGIFF